MLGAIDWGNLHVAGAFVLGALLATIAVLRVVRSVLAIFDERPSRARRRRVRDDEAE